MIDFFDLAFWKDFASNALATFLGAVLGMLSALWVNRRQQRTEGKKQEERRRERSEEQTYKIVVLLEQELLKNEELIDEWRNSDQRLQVTAILCSHIRDELWNAFSDGGELEVINDLILLSASADAYSSIRRVRLLAEKHFEATQNIKIQFEAERADRIANALNDAVTDAKKNIAATLKIFGAWLSIRT